MGSILRDLARFTVELDVKKLPEAVRGEAALKIVDSVAAGIGAAKNEQILRVVEQYRGLAGNQKAAPVWAQGFFAPLFTAVFVNAMQDSVDRKSVV